MRGKVAWGRFAPPPNRNRRCGSNRNGSGDPTLTRTVAILLNHSFRERPPTVRRTSRVSLEEGARTFRCPDMEAFLSAQALSILYYYRHQSVLASFDPFPTPHLGRMVTPGLAPPPSLPPLLKDRLRTEGAD